MFDDPVKIKMKKRNMASSIKEAASLGALVLIVLAMFRYYRGKAHGAHAMDGYISLGGYELSYLQTYHYFLILVWAMVGVLILVVAIKVHGKWEIHDFKKMLEIQRKAKKKNH